MADEDLTHAPSFVCVMLLQQKCPQYWSFSTRWCCANQALASRTERMAKRRSGEETWSEILSGWAPTSCSTMNRIHLRKANQPVSRLAFEQESQSKEQQPQIFVSENEKIPSRFAGESCPSTTPVVAETPASSSDSSHQSWEDPSVSAKSRNICKTLYHHVRADSGNLLQTLLIT